MKHFVKKTMKHIPFILLFLLGCTSPDNNSKVGDESNLQEIESTSSKNTTNVLKPVRVKAMTESVTEEDTVDATIKDRHYILYPDGKIAVQYATTQQTDTFHLKTDLIVDEAHFLDYKNDLIIYYSATDYESGSSFIEAFDRITNRRKWENDIYGFNLTDPIVVGNITYVAAIGFIGKLNLDNGKYIWKYDDLYEQTKFDAFGSIEISGDKVSFIQSQWVKETRQPGRIIVNDKTGEIEKIIKIAP